MQGDDMSSLNTIEASMFEYFIPQFDLETNQIIADPCEWEVISRGHLVAMQTINNEHAALGPYGAHSDILENGLPIAGNCGEDLKYHPVEEMSDRAMLQFGTCHFCYHDETYPATKRMKQYGARNFAMGHIVWHIHDLIAKGTPMDNMGNEGSSKSGNNKGSKSGNKKVILGLGLHSCPDLVCTKHSISQQVDLLTFVNHITMIHQIKKAVTINVLNFISNEMTLEHGVQRGT
jgi:hypothetical protein